MNAYDSEIRATFSHFNYYVSLGQYGWVISPYNRPNEDGKFPRTPSALRDVHFLTRQEAEKALRDFFTN